MPGYYKKAKALPVSPKEQDLLEQITRRSTSQQHHVTRARIILMAADGSGNQEIADTLSVSRRTVYHWRTRWLEEANKLKEIEAAETEKVLSRAILSTLSDAPRPGGPVTYNAETVCQIISVSCEDPEKCGHPISHWTPQALRLEVIDRGIVTDISVRQIGRFLKGGGSKAASGALLGTSSGSG